MSILNMVHYPVYLSFEKKIICCECQLYYKCKNCAKLCSRQLDHSFGFVYHNHDCDSCLKRVKILVCSNCNDVKCKGCKKSEG